jgi:hypothetical protein
MSEQKAPLSSQPTGSTGPKDAEYLARAEAADTARGSSQENTSDLDVIKDPHQVFAGKFNSAADLEKAYVELQAKMGAPKSDTPPPAQIPEGSPKGLTTETFQSFVSEYQTSGQLSEDSYTSLEKLGVSRDLVDSYVEGRKSTAAAAEEMIYKEVGGKESYQEVVSWASQNMSADDVEQYNKIVQEGDSKKAAFAAKSLMARYRAENSRGPDRTIEGKRGSADVGFASKAEMVAAMQDPRYAKDPAYRAQVVRRIGNTND